MNTLKSLRRAIFFVAVLAFRCATASNRYQRVAVTADPPDAVVTASAIVALPVVAALVGVGLRIFAEECFGAGGKRRAANQAQILERFGPHAEAAEERIWMTGKSLTRE